MQQVQLERLAHREVCDAATEGIESACEDVVRIDGLGLFGSERVGKFEHVAAERNLRQIIFDHWWRGIAGFGARDEYQLPVRATPEEEVDVREWLEFALEAPARSLCTLGDTAQFAELARQHRDYAIRLRVVARAEHDCGGGFFSGHGGLSHPHGDGTVPSH